MLEQYLLLSESWKSAVESDRFDTIESDLNNCSQFVREVLVADNKTKISEADIVLLRQLHLNYDALKLQVLAKREDIAIKLTKLKDGRRMKNAYELHQ